jgi:hypothetical protein
MDRWQQVMGTLSAVFAAVVVWLYFKGKLSLGPGGKEWDAQVDTDVTKANCPPPECDCALLRARIQYLERRLHDTENALLKAEGLYASLYAKYQALLRELEEWKQRALQAEAELEVCRRRVAELLRELAACHAALQELEARCLERAEGAACVPGGASQIGQLLR